MSTPAIIARNLFSNWGGFVFQVLVAFLLTPYIVKSLGNTYYGIWALIVSMTGYYGLFDLGFSASLVQYVTRYHATRDFNRLNQTMSTGFSLLAGLSLFLLVVSVGLALAAGQIFEIPAEAIVELRIAILIVGCGTALQFLFFPYSAVFPATQRFDIANVIGIGTRIFFAAAVYFALHQGYGLIGVSVATTASTLLDYVIRCVVAYRLMPELRVSPRLASADRVRELAHFAIWNVLIAGSVRLISYSDAVLIAIFLPPAAVTPFALATSLADYFMRIFVPIGQVFFPAMTERDALNDIPGMRQLFLSGTRLLAVMALPAGLMAFAFCDGFFALWIGPASADVSYPSAASLFSVLIVASVASAVQRVAYQVLLGSRRIKPLAICFIVEGTANVLMSVALVGPLGLMGVAIGTVIPALIVEGVIIPVLICRSLSISIIDYFSGVYGRAILITLALYPVVYAINSRLPPRTWGLFILDGVMAASVFGILVLALGLSGAERKRFVWNPVGKHWRNLH